MDSFSFTKATPSQSNTISMTDYKPTTLETPKGQPIIVFYGEATCNSWAGTDVRGHIMSPAVLRSWSTRLQVKNESIKVQMRQTIKPFRSTLRPYSDLEPLQTYCSIDKIKVYWWAFYRKKNWSSDLSGRRPLDKCKAFLLSLSMVLKSSGAETSLHGSVIMQPTGV